MEDHIKFSEVLASFDDLLVGQEDVAVQITDEIADELVSSVSIFILEYMHELRAKGREQVLCEGKAQAGFELVEENVAFYDPVGIPDQLVLDVHFDRVVEDVWERLLLLGIVQCDEPDVDLLYFLCDFV